MILIAWVLAKSMFESRLQYNTSHAIRTVASIVFGLIYVSIWQGIGKEHVLAGYGAAGMIGYISFNQVILWLSTTTHGLGIEERVRTGQIALDLVRPVHLFWFSTAREAGSMIYNAMFTSLPLYVLYVTFLGLPVPQDPLVWLRTALALIMASYSGACIGYCIGVTSLWTIESRWFTLFNYSFSFVLSGFLLPIEWMPTWLRYVAEASPYPIFHSVPTRLYLGKAGAASLLIPFAWCIAFTLGSLAMTRIVRRKVEVQGG
jgi:ABC-2 type transport system permease protein